MENRVRTDSGQRGASIVEMLLVAGLLAAIVVLGARTTRLVLHQTRVAELTHVGTELRAGLDRHFAELGRVPGSGPYDSGLNLETLAPLSTRGFVPESDELLSRLQDRRVLAYDATAENQYWLLLSDDEKPRLQILVARTDGYPAAKGMWLDGLYLVRPNGLERLEAGVTPPTESKSQRRVEQEVPRV